MALGVRVRFGAPEDAWLAPTYARHSVYVSARLPHAAADPGWFAALQDAAVELGGRPSWSGAHGLDAVGLAALYLRFGDVLAVRDEVDPRPVAPQRLPGARARPVIRAPFVVSGG